MMSGTPTCSQRTAGELTFVIGEMPRLLRLLKPERAVLGLTSLSLFLICFIIKINQATLNWILYLYIENEKFERKEIVKNKDKIAYILFKVYL